MSFHLSHFDFGDGAFLGPVLLKGVNGPWMASFVLGFCTSLWGFGLGVRLKKREKENIEMSNKNDSINESPNKKLGNNTLSICL